MGEVFEEICKQYLWSLLLKGEENFIDLGRWWGTNPKKKTQEEIDIMGITDKNTALFCECKWKNEDIDTSVLEKLIERGEIFSYPNKRYYLFSKTGFTSGCVDMANNLGNIKLVSYKDMIKI